MCNLYSMTRNREAILRLFRVPHNRAAAYEARDAIFPGYQAPVVRKAADGERELTVLNWGFVLLQKDRAPKRVTNIRDDKAQTKNSLLALAHSCLAIRVGLCVSLSTFAASSFTSSVSVNGA